MSNIQSPFEYLVKILNKPHTLTAGQWPFFNVKPLRARSPPKFSTKKNHTFALAIHHAVVITTTIQRQRYITRDTYRLAIELDRRSWTDLICSASFRSSIETTTMTNAICWRSQKPCTSRSRIDGENRPEELRDANKDHRHRARAIVVAYSIVCFFFFSKLRKISIVNNNKRRCEF